MPGIAELVRAALLPFLAVTGGLLFVLACYVLGLHGLNDARLRRRNRLLTLYRPIVDGALLSEESQPFLERLRNTPRSDVPIVGTLILEPLRVAEGAVTGRAHQAAAAIGLLQLWTADVDDRRWWVRADAARALGLLKHRPAVPALIRALDDPYEEVRAAAVEALGAIRDEAAVPELIARLGQQSRHQRVRLVQALRQFGSAAMDPLLERARQQRTLDSDELPLVLELLGQIEASAALDYLRECSSDARADVRAAAVRALGAVGIDDRSYYHVLRALTDDVPDVRAAAAWALGRSGRHDASAYLASCLQDQWKVAAESARALSNLGASGRAALESAAAAADGELARQMLWESGARSHI